MDAQTPEPKDAETPYCSGTGSRPCRPYGDALKVPPGGGAATDAFACWRDYLAWYGRLPWWRKLWL